MELPKKVVETVSAKSVMVNVKVVDTGDYTLLDENKKPVAEINEDYVPSFFPEQHYGDYLYLDIDLETGQILNWKKPAPIDVAKAFKLIEGDEE